MLIYFLVFFVPNVLGQNLGIPLTFWLGVGTSAYQSEGAWNEEVKFSLHKLQEFRISRYLIFCLQPTTKTKDKGPSVWDTMTHTHPELIANQSTGDVSADSYHFYKEDVANAHAMACQHYHFSISWSRLLPYGTPEYINPWAVEFYYSLIHEVFRYQMTPIITMYHWDLPQPLEDIGGWLNPEIVDHFVNYARILMDLFGISVAYWFTIDDPFNACVNTYEFDRGAPPVVRSPGIGAYLCGKHMLLAHATVYRMRKEEFPYRNIAIGFGMNAIWAEPKSNTTQEDLEAAEREMQMTLGWFMNPLINGDYPEIMKTRIEELSAAEGFIISRLPLLTEDEIALIKGTHGFLGIRTFNSYLISPAKISDNDPPSMEKDRGNVRELDPEWGPIGYPEGIRKLLVYIKETYDNPRLFVTTGYENENKSDLDDDDRVQFVQKFLRQIVLALNDDFCELQSFTFWSLMDQMEWRNGYRSTYGLYHVDFNTPNKTRTRKKSGDAYGYIVGIRIAS